MCMILIGDINGQIVENHIRSPEWNIFIPKRKPVQKWGQSFRSHGVALAGIAFWGSNGSDQAVSCKVQIRKDGPNGATIGPARTARGHDSRHRPIIRYPDVPGPLPGYESYYPDTTVDPPTPASAAPKRMADVFQVCYGPEELPLTPGNTYYVQVTCDEPLMMFADGDYYKDGYAYCDDVKVEEDSGLQHGDRRWTLVMTIVTYSGQQEALESNTRNQKQENETREH